MLLLAGVVAVCNGMAWATLERIWAWLGSTAIAAHLHFCLEFRSGLSSDHLAILHRKTDDFLARASRAFLAGQQNLLRSFVGCIARPSPAGGNLKAKHGIIDAALLFKN